MHPVIYFTSHLVISIVSEGSQAIEQLQYNKVEKIDPTKNDTKENYDIISPSHILYRADVPNPPSTISEALENKANDKNYLTNSEELNLTELTDSYKSNTPENTYWAHGLNTTSNISKTLGNDSHGSNDLTNSEELKQNELVEAYNIPDLDDAYWAEVLNLSTIINKVPADEAIENTDDPERSANGSTYGTGTLNPSSSNIKTRGNEATLGNVLTNIHKLHLTEHADGSKIKPPFNNNKPVLIDPYSVISKKHGNPSSLNLSDENRSFTTEKVSFEPPSTYMCDLFRTGSGFIQHITNCGHESKRKLYEEQMLPDFTAQPEDRTILPVVEMSSSPFSTLLRETTMKYKTFLNKVVFNSKGVPEGEIYTKQSSAATTIVTEFYLDFEGDDNDINKHTGIPEYTSEKPPITTQNLNEKEVAVIKISNATETLNGVKPSNLGAGIFSLVKMLSWMYIPTL